MNIELNIIACPTYPDKFIRDNVGTSSVRISIVIIVTLPPTATRFTPKRGFGGTKRHWRHQLWGTEARAPPSGPLKLRHVEKFGSLCVHNILSSPRLQWWAVADRQWIFLNLISATELPSLNVRLHDALVTNYFTYLRTTVWIIRNQWCNLFVTPPGWKSWWRHCKTNPIDVPLYYPDSGKTGAPPARHISSRCGPGNMSQFLWK